MVNKDKFLDLMFNSDYINKMTDKDMDELVDKVVNTINTEKDNKTKIDIVDTMVEELYKDMKEKEEDILYKVYQYRVRIDTFHGDNDAVLCVSFSEDFDEFENFVFDRLNNDKFIGFKVYNNTGKEYSRFFKCSEIGHISIERAE